MASQIPNAFNSLIAQQIGIAKQQMELEQELKSQIFYAVAENEKLIEQIKKLEKSIKEKDQELKLKDDTIQYYQNELNNIKIEANNKILATIQDKNVEMATIIKQISGTANRVFKEIKRIEKENIDLANEVGQLIKFQLSELKKGENIVDLNRLTKNFDYILNCSSNMTGTVLTAATTANPPRAPPIAPIASPLKEVTVVQSPKKVTSTPQTPFTFKIPSNVPINPIPSSVTFSNPIKTPTLPVARPASPSVVHQSPKKKTIQSSAPIVENESQVNAIFDSLFGSVASFPPPKK